MEINQVDTTVDIIIGGAGFAGLCLGAQFKQQGEHSFLILERGHDIGGTWRDNNYPGAACDVPSHLYSFSFSPNPDWSKVYSPQGEILDYLRDVAMSHELLPHLRYNEEILSARWDDTSKTWAVKTPTNEYRCKVFVGATGHLSDLKFPQIEGIRDFGGQLFHSADWNHGVQLEGKRIGVIGTGASAIQVIPQMAKIAGHLTVFQRSAPYVISREERAYKASEQAAFRKMPELIQELRRDLFWTNEGNYAARRGIGQAIEKAKRQALDHLAEHVKDPVLREKLTPQYDFGCKRMLISNTYYPALVQQNVYLETAGIERVTTDGILTEEGAQYDLDVLIVCTGFEATDLPLSHRIYGTDGTLLADQWADKGMSAYKTSTVHGFPNMFILNGPNTGLGHNSVVYIIEAQSEYIAGALKYMKMNDVDVLAVSEAAEEAYMCEIDRRSQGTVWLAGGCSNWYVDPRNGRLTVVWPEFAFAYRDENAEFDPAQFSITQADEKEMVS